MSPHFQKLEDVVSFFLHIDIKTGPAKYPGKRDLRGRKEKSWVEMLSINRGRKKCLQTLKCTSRAFKLKFHNAPGWAVAFLAHKRALMNFTGVQWFYSFQNAVPLSFFFKNTFI